MNDKTWGDGHRGFTLIELLVVISIITLLIALLIPAVSTIRNQANVTATKGEFTAIKTGIELYRAEQALGGSLPPSSGDDPANRHKIADPAQTTATANTTVAGAHLLLQAMLGADLLGPPGFKDFDRNGFWSNDTHGAPGPTPAPGAYALDPTSLEPIRPRYPSGGSYVDDDMRIKNVRSLEELLEEGVAVIWPDAEHATPTKDLKLFVDKWQRPILYYRATRGARQMIASAQQTGIYRQEDNGILTGSVNGTLTLKGVDFGKGEQGTSKTFSAIGKADAPAPTDDIDNDATFDESFARFILDRSYASGVGGAAAAKGRVYRPVRKNGFLLISAGLDQIYGTTDDVVNWTREFD